MTPRQFAGWWQYYRLAPWGVGWDGLSKQTARLYNLMRQLAPNVKTTEADLVEDDFLVPKWRKPSDDPYLSDVEQQCAAADSIEGFGF